MRSALLALVAALAVGCTTVEVPRVRSINDAVASASATLEGAAKSVKRMCGNTAPGGDCQEGSLITTERKNAIAEDIRQATEDLQTVLNLSAAGESADAADVLDRIDAYLLALLNELNARAEL